MAAASDVSAVIPVHNGAAYVADAIASVLNQTRAPIECLVIDDGSTDTTPDLARQFGADVTYVRQDQAGVSMARNRGVALAHGGLVAFLDHDDVWLPGKLELQVQALEDQRATLARCAVEVIDDRGSLLETKRQRPGDDLLTGMLMFDGTEALGFSSTAVVRRETLLELGGFDPRLSVSADRDMLLRLLLAGAVAYVDEPLARIRRHDTNMSRNVHMMERDLTCVYAKAFAEPRLPDAVRRRRRRAYARMYRMLAGSYAVSGERREAIRALALAARRDPRMAFEPFRRGRFRLWLHGGPARTGHLQ